MCICCKAWKIRCQRYVASESCGADMRTYVFSAGFCALMILLLMLLFCYGSNLQEKPCFDPQPVQIGVGIIVLAIIVVPILFYAMALAIWICCGFIHRWCRRVKLENEMLVAQQ